MNQPKLAISIADAERVVRQLADSLNSLKAKPRPPACSAPVQEQQPARPQKDRVQPVRPVSRAVPAVRRRMPARPTSQTVTVALPPMPAFKRAPRSAAKDGQVSSQREIIQDFCGDRELVERLGVTPEEIQTLSSVSMLGNLTSKQDALFILRQIREASGPYVSPSTPETLKVPYQRIEPAIPDIGEMAEWIRSEALAKLRKLESMQHARSRGPLGQLDFLSSIRTMLSWRRQPSPR